jgi:hypothetical protein
LADGAKITRIDAFNQAREGEDRLICDTPRAIIDAGLPEAESKIWHAHPVWFLAGTPIVGYSELMGCVRLLFWSGRSQIDAERLRHWLAESRSIQWDYKNLMTKRRLERISLA